MRYSLSAGREGLGLGLQGSRSNFARTPGPRRLDTGVARYMGLLVAAAILVLCEGSASAATFTWSGSGAIPPFNNNNWSNPFNWDGLSIPPTNGTAAVVIPDTPRDSPVVDVAWNIDTLTFLGAGTYTLSGQPLTLQGDLVNSSTNAATLNGPLVVGAAQTWLANTAPLIVNGVVSGNVANFLVQGNHSVTFGGVAANTFSNQIRVPEGKLILSKSVANGAVVGDIQIGQSSGSTATLQLAASEQISEAVGVTVSVAKTGVFDLNQKVETVRFITVAGAVLSNGGRLTALDELNLSGGVVELGSGELVAEGRVTVSAAPAIGTINASLMRLGAAGTRFDVIQAGAAIQLEVNAVIADSTSGPSMLEKDFEGIVRLTGANIYTGGTQIDKGALRVDNTTGSATGTGPVTVFGLGRLEGDGAASGSVAVVGGGTIAPLGSLGTGPLTLSATSQSQFRLGGLVQGMEYDFLDVNGAANLGGNLRVRLTNIGFALTGQTFTILDAASIAGAYANVANGARLRTLEGRGSFIVNYGAGSPFGADKVVLSNFALAADFDKDGDVDCADLTIWRGAFGLNNLGDADGDNDSDGADLLLWQQQLGSAPAAAVAAAVPEPGSATLLAAWAAWAAAGRTRRGVLRGASPRRTDREAPRS